MTSLRYGFWIVALMGCAVACDDLPPLDPGPPPAPEPDVTIFVDLSSNDNMAEVVDTSNLFLGGDQITHIDQDTNTGVITTRIDATSDNIWVYFDLDTGNQIMPEDENLDTTWDIAFQRFLVRINGGEGGTADVAAAIVTDADFASVSVPDESTFAQDQPDGDDENDRPDRVFDTWYDYNSTTHTLSPASQVYIIRSTENQYFKLAFETYYHPTESPASAYPAFRWTRIDP